MSCTAAMLYGVSGILEVVGLIVTIRDISAARSRLSGFLTRTRFVFGQETVRAEDSFTPPVVAGESQTIEQRVANLEQWTQGVPQQIAQWDERLVSCLSRSYHGDLEATQKTINHQLDGLREYAEGSKQSVWGSYKGPILLVVGVLVGTVANFVALGG